MELALALGTSPKRLTGWEPATVVRVLEHDEEGRPAAYRIEREPEWDEEQVDLLLAADELAGEVGAHGIPMDEATSPFADPNDPFHGWHYEAALPRIDHAQRALNTAMDQRREAYPEEDAGSLLWRLNRIEDGPLPTPAPTA